VGVTYLILDGNYAVMVRFLPVSRKKKMNTSTTGLTSSPSVDLLVGDLVQFLLLLP